MPARQAAPQPVLDGAVLTVRVIDVGQGDAILIVSPTGKTVLIDAGDRGKHRTVLAQLAEDEITSLDLVVMTHPHADHIGGMKKTLESVPTRVFLDPGFDYASGTYADLLAHLERSQTKVVLARAGRRIDIGGDASLTVLWPAKTLLRGTRSDANSNSIVLRLDYGQVSMLLTGDAEEPTEHGLLDQAELLDVDILKVAHHGSSHSSTSAFLAAVSPSLALISCGIDNKFDHPKPDALARLAEAGAVVARTDLQGTITVSTDGQAWRTDVARGPPVGAEPDEAAVAAARAYRAARRMHTTGSHGGISRREVFVGGPTADINTATADQLTAVKGIGPGKAQAIVDYREANGPFTSISALTAVSGIGPTTVTRIARRFHVGAPPAAPSSPAE